jgi:YfiR/HmsC-like
MHPNRQRRLLGLQTLRTRLWAPLLLALAMTGLAPAALPTPQEYISGFVLYVRWPDDAAVTAWQICVAAPAGPNDAQYADLVVRERKFAVRHVAVGDALGSCHVLDLTAADAAATQGFLKTTQTLHGLLTVGDGKDFCSAGGLICLHLREPHGGFEVNLSAVKNAGFIINARLLMMARQPAAEGAPP